MIPSIWALVFSISMDCHLRGVLLCYSAQEASNKSEGSVAWQFTLSVWPRLDISGYDLWPVVITLVHLERELYANTHEHGSRRPAGSHILGRPQSLPRRSIRGWGRGAGVWWLASRAVQAEMAGPATTHWQFADGFDALCNQFMIRRLFIVDSRMQADLGRSRWLTRGT